MQMKNIEPFKLNIVVTKNEKERVTYAEYSDTFCKEKLNVFNYVFLLK